ncbi:hypothetical protein D3C87_1742170 [compost metagenome]
MLLSPKSGASSVWVGSTTSQSEAAAVSTEVMTRGLVQRAGRILVSNTTLAPASRALTMAPSRRPRARGARMASVMPEK